MALALYGCGSSHPLTTWGENLGVRAYPETVRYWELPHPERARVIRKSIYYVEMVKFPILGLDQQFSPINKEFFFHIYLQKHFCSFSFLRLEFSFGMLFRQFGNFSKSSCQLIVLPYICVRACNWVAGFSLSDKLQCKQIRPFTK